MIREESQTAVEDHKGIITDHFRTQASLWREIYEQKPDQEKYFTCFEVMRRKEGVLDLLDRHAGDRRLRVLDIGCGTGLFMESVLRRGHYVIGLDISEEMLNEARNTIKKYPEDRASALLGDAEKLPFDDGSIDVVFCIGVLQYQKRDEGSIREISRVLRNGGIAIVTIPNMFSISNFLDPYYYLVRLPKYLISRSMHNGKSKDAYTTFKKNTSFMNRRYRYGQLNPLFRSCSLDREAVIGIGYGPISIWRHEMLPLKTAVKISEYAEKLARKRSAAILNRFANRWIFCLRKKEQ